MGDTISRSQSHTDTHTNTENVDELAEPNENKADTALDEQLRDFSLHASQRIAIEEAWRESPDGVKRVIEQARRGRKPEALLTSLISRGDHRRSQSKESDDDLLKEFLAENGGRWPTGSRWVRGTHAGTYNKDPLGYDRPNYEVPWGKPSRDRVIAALRDRHALETSSPDVSKRPASDASAPDPDLGRIAPESGSGQRAETENHPVEAAESQVDSDGEPEGSTGTEPPDPPSPETLL